MLSYTLNNTEVITSSIYDISGRIVKTWSENISAGYHEDQIEISNLSPGIYQLELRNNNSRKVIRFQVIK